MLVEFGVDVVRPSSGVLVAYANPIVSSERPAKDNLTIRDRILNPVARLKAKRFTNAERYRCSASGVDTALGHIPRVSVFQTCRKHKEMESVH